MVSIDKKTLLAVVTFFITSFIIDSILHLGVTNGIAEKELAGALKPTSEINFLPLIVEYLIVAAGIIYFMRETNAYSKPVFYSALIGAIIGFMIYGIYGFINVSLLVKWSWIMVVVNTLIGVIVLSASAALVRVIFSPSQRKKP